MPTAFHRQVMLRRYGRGARTPVTRRFPDYSVNGLTLMFSDRIFIPANGILFLKMRKSTISGAKNAWGNVILWNFLEGFLEGF